jgi:GNAT superfamily N-acetyltransferase
VVSVMPAEIEDLPAICDLMEELDRFYGASEFEERAERIKQISAALFGEQPAAYLLLAKDGGDVVGLAAYSFLWPAAGITRSLFLKELYVVRARLRQGVGRALMQQVAEMAATNGCSRLEWQTDTPNLDAQRFYEALGAPARDGKVFYRLDGEAIGKLAATGSAALG